MYLQESKAFVPSELGSAVDKHQGTHGAMVVWEDMMEMGWRSMIE